MKITIVGSSHGYPEANRKCASFLIEVAGRLYFVDMGTMPIEFLIRRGLRPEDVQGIFLTHMHGDHTNGLFQFVDLCNWYYQKANPVICLPDMGAVEIFDAWLRMTTLSKLRDYQYREVKPGVVFDDGVLRVTAIRTQHLAVSYAYLIEAEGKRVVFTGDLKNPQVDFPVEAGDAPLDLVICEAAHFPATDYLQVFDRLDIAKVCVTHYSYRFLGSVLELQKALGEREKEMLFASDDLDIVV